MTEALLRAIERFEALGLADKMEDGTSRLWQPHAFGTDLHDGAALADVSGRLDKSVSRLEEVRAMARNLGLPEEQLSDESKDGKPGFKDRLITFTASDETMDRYGDRISVDGSLDGRQFAGPGGKGKAKGWGLGNYKKNPVFMAFHEYSPTISGNQFAGVPLGLAVDTWPNVSRNRKRLSQTVLFATGASNPMSPLVLAAYKDDRTMRGVSVGFMPEVVYEPEDDAERKMLGIGTRGYVFAQQELWENSAVSIPANPNALVQQMDVTKAAELREFSERLAEHAPEMAYVVRCAIQTGREMAEVIEPYQPSLDRSTPPLSQSGNDPAEPTAALKTAVDAMNAAREELRSASADLRQAARDLSEGGPHPADHFEETIDEGFASQLNDVSRAIKDLTASARK